MIRYLLSKLLLIEAALLLVPVGVATYYQESSQVFIALFTTIGILVLLGSLGVYPTTDKVHNGIHCDDFRCDNT